MCSFSDYPGSIHGVRGVRRGRRVLHLGDQWARLHLVLLCGFDLN